MVEISNRYDYIPFEKLAGKNILVTGGNGLIGGAIIDFMMENNVKGNIFAMVRNRERAESRFKSYLLKSHFHIIKSDVNVPLENKITFHYMINAASNANPNAYATDPVGTMWTNINGTKQLLDYGRKHGLERFLYVSSGEVYGEGDVECWDENDYGYVNDMMLRSCYPMSKRAAETMCVAYSNQFGIDIVVARPCHTYGPYFTNSDTRAYAQFIRKVRNHEDIVLKSKGEQFRSWIYTEDCASAILVILLKGKNGEAYNVANEESCVTIKELAEQIAKLGKSKVVYDIPTEEERKGFSVIRKSIFSTKKIKGLGWNPKFSLGIGLSLAIKG